jgi:hypothetical protein
MLLIMDCFVESTVHFATHFGGEPYNESLKGSIDKCANAGGGETGAHATADLRMIFEYKDHGKRTLKDMFSHLKKTSDSETAVGNAMDEVRLFTSFHEQYEMKPTTTMACVVVDYLHNHSAEAKDACKAVRENVFSVPHKAHRPERLSKLLEGVGKTVGQDTDIFKNAMGSMAVATKKPARIDSMVKMVGVFEGACRTFGDVSDAMQAVLLFLGAARSLAKEGAPLQTSNPKPPEYIGVAGGEECAGPGDMPEKMNIDSSIEEAKEEIAVPQSVSVALSESEKCKMEKSESDKCKMEIGDDSVHDTSNIKFAISRHMLQDGDAVYETSQHPPIVIVGMDFVEQTNHLEPPISEDADFDTRFKTIFEDSNGH